MQSNYDDIFGEEVEIAATNKYGITEKSLAGQPKAYTVQGWKDVFIRYLQKRETDHYLKPEIIKGGIMAGEVVGVPIGLPLSIESFCVFAGINRQTFLNYEKRSGYEQYFEVTTRMREIIEAEQLDKATVGAYNQNIIAYRLGFMRKEGMLSDSEPDDLSRYVTKGTEASIVYVLNVHSTQRIRVNRGGTRSTKTYSLSQIAVDWLLTGKIGEQSILEGDFDIVRKTLPALKASVLKDLIELISARKLTKIIKHHKTDKTFTIKNTSRRIQYYSVDDEHKVRGAKRKILWINEANGVNFDDFRQLNMRGVELCFLDFNPSEFNNWIKEEIEEKRFNKKKDVEVITSTYRDNLFLTPQEVEEIEYLEKGSSEFWAVFGQGKYAKLTGIVYPNWELYDAQTFDHAVKRAKTMHVQGVDFGMTAPTAIIDIHVDFINRVVYLEEIAYRTHLGTAAISKIIHESADGCPVVCDSAEPRTIGELRKMGNGNVIACAKKSIVSDIRRINGFTLIIREGSHNITREISAYHRPSKDGKVISETPVPGNDHALDGIRYGVIYAMNTYKPPKKK